MPTMIDLTAVYRHAYRDASVTPFPFQRAVAETADADVLMAPTGLGKTAAVTLGWAWRRMTMPAATPRRLIWCLPMRTLVEQTHCNAQDWMGQLAGLFEESGQSRPKVHIVMGGAVEDDWRLAPDEAAIVVGTQDMLLSRALMRGFGMSRFGWAVDYGLLHADALWVFDEVQLMGAGLATSAQLEAFRRHQGWCREGLARSLWVSATLDPKWLETAEFRREVPHPKVQRWNDLAVPEPAELRDRLDAGKRLRKAETSLGATDANSLRAYVRALAKEIGGAHRKGTTTLVIVNTVRRAQLLYTELEAAGCATELLLLHSRYRQPGRDGITERLLKGAGSDRVVVATQAVEAGVDMTSATLFTELAPWTSVVQRFGRCNRAGECGSDGAAVYWIDVEAGRDEAARPYQAAELEEARRRLAELKEVCPRTLIRLPPTPPPPSRQVIRPKDFEELFDTDPDLSGYDLDISPYIRDGGDMSVEILWRDLGDTPANRLEARPPRREELCAAPLGEIESWLTPKGKPIPPYPVYVEDPLASRRGERKRRRSDLSWVRLDKSNVRLRPGLTLLLDASMGGYDTARGFVGKERQGRVEPVPAPDRAAAAVQDAGSGETVEGDPQSYGVRVTLADHTEHVVAWLRRLAGSLRQGHGIAHLEEDERKALERAAWWHDLGKAYAPFQERLGREPGGPLLAKSARNAPENGAENATEPAIRESGSRRLRRHYRHELASALAFLAQHDGEPDADLVAYLIAAHHGKVRMGLRALPEEEPDAARRQEVPPPRICRGVQDGDALPEVRLDPETSQACTLDLSLMELGEDERGRPSWSARTQGLLARLGPFRLAYLEALLRMADWRASAEERGETRDA